MTSLSTMKTLQTVMVSAVIFSHHVHRYLTDWSFAMLLFEVFDPALFFRDEVCQDIF